ncbi:MAG: DUF3419 family protein [Saprospiraceae bacterium]
MTKEKDQIPLFKLVFTHNWEDPESDHTALKIQPGDTVLAITSGGCNVLGFLLFDPEVIYSVDINPAQSYLMELKMAAIRQLDFEEFISFAGLKYHPDRKGLYSSLRPSLSPEAVAFWDTQVKIVSRGFVMNGKYERFIKLAGSFITFLQGKGRVRGLFKTETKAEQENYFDQVWHTKRFYWMFNVLFNKRVLARRGLVADYFHFDDGCKSFAESFYNRSKKAFRDIPIQGNYFVSLYLTGKYRNETEVPAYLRKEHYEVIKSRLMRIKIITDDAQSWIDSMPSGSINCFALSNICELMSERDTFRLFDAVQRTARPGARVIFRNLMIPREVPASLTGLIVKDERLSLELYSGDRSFVYGKVAAYLVKPEL